MVALLRSMVGNWSRNRRFLSLRLSIFGMMVLEPIGFRSFVLCWCWKDDRITVEAGRKVALRVALIIAAVLPFLVAQL